MEGEGRGGEGRRGGEKDIKQSREIQQTCTSLLKQYSVVHTHTHTHTDVHMHRRTSPVRSVPAYRDGTRRGGAAQTVHHYSYIIKISHHTGRCLFA